MEKYISFKRIYLPLMFGLVFIGCATFIAKPANAEILQVNVPGVVYPHPYVYDNGVNYYRTGGVVYRNGTYYNRGTYYRRGGAYYRGRGGSVYHRGAYHNGRTVYRNGSVHHHGHWHR
jgi:hypothetical protein